MTVGPIGPYRLRQNATNLQHMVTSGPKHPLQPRGPAHDMSLAATGGGIRYQEFEDGWVYELYSPVGADPAIVPRAKTAKLVFEGRWMAAFEDEGTNYLTLWVDRKTHDALFPAGPPRFRFYSNPDVEQAREQYSTWVDPNDTNPSTRTGELKLVEIAKLMDGETS